MTKLENLLQKIQDKPDEIDFSDMIEAIDDTYQYRPCSFTNGPDKDCLINQAGENEGSCKIFAFAKKHHLSEQQTLHCFGKYYREDVLKHPGKDDHQNIRTFIKYGWKNIHFEGEPLTNLPAE
jgi:hypothetical protein